MTSVADWLGSSGDVKFNAADFINWFAGDPSNPFSLEAMMLDLYHLQPKGRLAPERFSSRDQEGPCNLGKRING